MSDVYGNIDIAKGEPGQLDLDEGELITTALLFGDGSGRWLGHIYIKTNQGKTLDFGRDISKIDTYEINVGSGILLGAVISAHEGDIGNLAWLFLGQPIDHIEINDVQFKQDPAGSSSGITPNSQVLGEWFNNLDSNQSYGLPVTHSVTSSYT